ncbi:MAG TPA: CPBP family intramembrane glutamic endopeptidase [Candidatus Limnocylindrales bacterium]
MTFAAGQLVARDRRAAGLGQSIAIGLALLAVVGARWAATAAQASPLVVGALFGLALLGIAWAGGYRPAAIRAGSVIIGLAGAAVLVGLAIGASRLAGLPLRVVPQTDFGWWALITVLVASAEELILRGVLFDALTESGGIALAMAVTSIVFALIHVPLYGWHVVPLDLGVGVFLGGLRLVSGSVAAPAIAHIGADLATWWL